MISFNVKLPDEVHSQFKETCGGSMTAWIRAFCTEMVDTLDEADRRKYSKASTSFKKVMLPKGGVE